MGAAEDAVRRRQAAEALSIQERNAQDEKERNDLNDSIQIMASQLREQLDRLEWPDGKIGHVQRAKERLELAYIVVVAGKCVVASDGNAYYQARVYKDIEDFDDVWMYPDCRLILTELTNIHDVMKERLESLRSA